MTLYQIHGFQPDDAPHWSAAMIEADSENEAREILLGLLLDDAKRPDTIWGWGDNYGYPDYQNAEKWRVDPWETPVRFVLGGGCR